MRKYFITGLLILVPLAITLLVLNWIVGMVDGLILPWIPAGLRTEGFLGIHIPGWGFVLTVLIVLVTGLLAHNIIGKRMVLLWESLLNRIPVVRSIYSSVKQVSDTLFSSSGNAFRKAVLVQYPRAGVYTIAFVTGTPSGQAAAALQARGATDFVSVYVPTTPNPTSGFFLMLPRADILELDMSVDEALKYIISMGVVAPVDLKPKAPL